MTSTDPLPHRRPWQHLRWLKESLAGEECPACNRYKPKRLSLCRMCWQRLPKPVAHALYRSFFEQPGYVEAHAAAMQALGARYPHTFDSPSDPAIPTAQPPSEPIHTSPSDHVSEAGNMIDSASMGPGVRAPDPRQEDSR